MNILKDLEKRGLLYQTTNRGILEKRLKVGPITLYIGFDPTADSLHIGNLLPILCLRRFQMAGHNPIAVAGGGTGLIGDPSGRSLERMLNPETVVYKWTEKIKHQLERFLDFKSKTNPARIVNNYDWLSNIKVIEFLRDTGKHFSIGNILSKESVKSRLDAGISYTEFSYMILQAYDFLRLYQDYKCEMQAGGSDQWGNITAGVDLIKKVAGGTAFGLTFPLITKSDETKFGKTETGTIWLDPKKTTPYQFYQFWINAEDAKVIEYLKYYTFLDLDEIKKLEKRKSKTREGYEPHLGIHLEITASPIINEQGEITGCVHVARDITERKRMQEKLMLTDRLASIGELASGVAHELNNPLTSVIGFSHLLMDKDLPVDIKEDLKIINREAQRTADVVRNLLTFARRHQPSKQPVKVNNILNKMLELRTYEQKVNNIKVIKHFADLPDIMADYFQLQQVFLNIIINAEYFMIEAHGKGTLTIVTEKVVNAVRVTLADDGPGMPGETIGHIFSPFFTTKPVGKGTGLGLSICHGIITTHGGRIWAESQPGKGATFFMELPIGEDKPGGE